MRAGALALIARSARRGARELAVGAVVAVIWGWGVAQFPYLLPERLTISAGAAPRRNPDGGADRVRRRGGARAAGARVLVHAYPAEHARGRIRDARPGRRRLMRESEFNALFAAVSNWGRWSDRPERGALNELTPERIVGAAGLVRSGVTVSLRLPLDTEARIDNPEPADHRMPMLPDVGTSDREACGSRRTTSGSTTTTTATVTSTPFRMSPTTVCSTTGHRRSR